MDTQALLPLIGRLVAAALLGGFVGYQRERARHPAGLRTHMLVAIGACLITIVSEFYPVGEKGRLSAQIVSGIGFLGAGTIIRDGQTVRGLTTAASLWAVAGLGIAAGHGGLALNLGVVATLIILLTLTVVDVIEDTYIQRAGRRNLALWLDPGALPLVFETLIEQRAIIHGIMKQPPDSTGSQHVSLRLSLPRGRTDANILQHVQHIPGVRMAGWDVNLERDTTETENDA